MHNPRVGVASLVLHDGRLLLGPRHKMPDDGSWQLPGGFMNPGESVFRAAIRLAEIKAGVAIRPLQSGPSTNNIFSDGNHTVSLYVLADLESGQNAEKLAVGWQWFNPNNLPQPLFYPLQMLFEQHNDWLQSLGIFR